MVVTTGTNLIKTLMKKFIFLRYIRKPIAIYVGTLANWVDYDLLNYVANKNKNISFVLIGYTHTMAPQSKLQELFKLDNIYYLGYKKFELLPYYIKQSDVCLVPYDQNNYTLNIQRLQSF